MNMSDVYLVGRNTFMRDGLHALLDAAGLTIVGESDNKTEILAAVGELGPTVLLLDLHIGQRASYDLLREMQRFPKNIRTIVLASFSQARFEREAMRLGAIGFLIKEASSVELLKAIAKADTALRNGESLSSASHFSLPTADVPSLATQL